MMNYQQQQQKPELQEQQVIQAMLQSLFAPEDEVLNTTRTVLQEAGMHPAMQISPVQGKLLQILTILCQARKVLEIGILVGYSGIWLARGLPPDGHLITLEKNARNAAFACKAFEQAGLAQRVEVCVGDALTLLPALETGNLFDLIFIDADKAAYPAYLDWALKLSRPGGIIVADNCIDGGRALKEGEQHNADSSGLFQYNQRVLKHPRLVSLALPLEDNYTDGFTISIVRRDM